MKNYIQNNNLENDGILAVRIPQAAKMLSCSIDHIRRLIKAGELESWKAGGIRLISMASLRAFVAGGDR